MIADLRYAFRSLLKSPGFTLVALLTLGLGIGVNTSMYTLVDVLLFRSAPFPEPDRLLVVQSRTPQGQEDRFSLAEIGEMRAQTSTSAGGRTDGVQTQAFESLTAFAMWDNALAEPGQPAERLFSLDASADFFKTFRVQPMLGRSFTADEQVPGRNQVALLSHALWQSRFGGDPSIIGRTLRLNSEQVTVIGVMPASFTYPLFFGKVDLLRPVTVPRDITENRNTHFFQAVGRLNPGVNPSQATAQLIPVLSQWCRDYPQNNAGRGIYLQPMHKATMARTDQFMVWLLFGIGGVILLIACFNIANLQLSRAASTTRDLAIRSALGASRASLVVQQLTESIVLALGGGVLGVMVATWANALIGRAVSIGEAGSAGSLELPMNGPVLVAAFLISLLSGLLFGLVPAWLASRSNVASALKQQSRGSSSGRSTHLFRHSLIVVQVALALAALATAGVMIRGLGALLQKEKGWDTSHVLAASIHLPEQTTLYNSGDKRRLAIEKLSRRLAQIPNAEHTGICTDVPFFEYSTMSPVEVQGQTSDEPAKQPIAGYTMVASEYFATLGITLLEGRLFPPELKADAPPLVVINETMARHFWPGESAVGKRIGDRQGDTVVWRQVIGVVRDIQFAMSITNPDTLFQVYKPMVNEPWGYMFLLVRGATPAAFKKDVLRAVADIDPDVAVQEVFTIPESTDRYMHNIVVINNTLGGFALLGLFLASLGLYGVISNLVAQRTGEFGIRLALGAKPCDVIGLVLGTGVRLTLIGLVIGSVLAYALNRTLQAFMPRMAGSDPVTIALVAMLLFGIALLACWLPARRATKIDPIIALRAD
ncbi:MAG: ABC transporter permease [Verrucomicrobia bacterium]|nr:ABC transporter permease [Verrucomicrobiota bacterium]